MAAAQPRAVGRGLASAAGVCGRNRPRAAPLALENASGAAGAVRFVVPAGFWLLRRAVFQVFALLSGDDAVFDAVLEFTFVNVDSDVFAVC